LHNSSLPGKGGWGRRGKAEVGGVAPYGRWGDRRPWKEGREEERRDGEGGREGRRNCAFVNFPLKPLQ